MKVLITVTVTIHGENQSSCVAEVERRLRNGCKTPAADASELDIQEMKSAKAKAA